MGNSHRKRRNMELEEEGKYDLALHSLELNNCDIHILKGLLKLGMPVNVHDERGKTPLHYAVLKNRLKVVKFLLCKRDIQIDVVDGEGHSALTLALMHDVPDCAFELIKQGADINLTNNKGYTPLHYAVLYSTNKLFHFLLVNGPNIDAQNLEGETALHLACERCCDPQKILMLLYYGADALISCKQGTIPLSLVIENEFLPSFVKEILYNYTMDEMVVLNLKTVVKAMASDSPLFSIVLDKVCDVTYDKSDLEYLNDHLPTVDPKCFNLFLKKFDHVVKDLLINCNTITNYLLMAECIKRVTPYFLEFFYILLNSHLAFEAVQSCCPSISVISSLAKVFYKSKLPLEELTKLACAMLSYGLNVTPTDVNAIYTYYGRCELFELLLYMDIEKITSFECECCTICDYELVQDSIMAHLAYDVNLTMDKFLAKPLWFLSLDLDMLLDYFALPKLKQFFKSDYFTGLAVQDKVLKMPTVPYLVELARDATRLFIKKKYKIRNSRQFYTIIKWLPIADQHKKILCYERKLYV